MKKIVPFFKMSAAGNDFVLVDQKHIRNPRAKVSQLCDRREGIGADGLLVVYKKPRLGFDYYNADGSLTFCGNGMRAVAWWINQQGWAVGKKSFDLKTPQGMLNAKISAQERVSIEMPKVKNARLNIPLKISGRAYVVHFIDTGVPHAVVFVKNLQDFPVADLGRAFRWHQKFKPRGVNVDFVEIKSGKLHIRTYEKGVEAETLACGTGAVAAAIVSASLGFVRSPVSVIARGGGLRVSFNSDSFNKAQDIHLEGPAKVIYRGKLVP